jgi:hypothetical protein
MLVESRRGLSGWRFSQWCRSREYQALLATLAGLALLQLVRVWRS